MLRLFTSALSKPLQEASPDCANLYSTSFSGPFLDRKKKYYMKIKYEKMFSSEQNGKINKNDL